MKGFIFLLLFSPSIFALSPDWTSISCSLSASRMLDNQFANPLSFPDRISFYRTGNQIEFKMKSHEGKILLNDKGDLLPGKNEKMLLFQSKRFKAEIGYLEEVRTEVKIYKNNSANNMVAHLLCNSN